MQPPHILPIDRPERQIPVWFGVLVLLALWLLARPYVGLRHDGVLYLGQVLLHMRPEVMANDLFFAHGSQEGFTIVTQLLLALYRRWDVATVQVVLLFVCHGGLLAALWVLLRPLDTLQRWWALIGIAVLSHVYAGIGIFAFAERFITARTLAEPVGLAALAFLLVGRRGAALVAAAAALVIHPLMAIPVLVVGWMYLMHQDRRWGWAAATALIPLFAAFAGYRPFSALLETYDAAWWAGVNEVNAQVLIGLWKLADWQTFVLDLGLLIAGYRLLPSPLAQLCRALMLATLMLMGISAIGADLTRNVFVTQLQLWRVLWLTHLIALAILPAVFLVALRQPKHGPVLAWSIAVAVVATNARWEAAWVFQLWLLIVVWLEYRGQELSRALHRAVQSAMAVALLGLSTAVLSSHAYLLAESKQALDSTAWTLLAATMPTVAFPIGVLFLKGWGSGGVRAGLTLLAAVCLVGYAGGHWDRRTEWTRTIESGLYIEHPFTARIPQKAQVFWPGNTAATWMLLKRASFHSPEQGAGALFNRQTSIEAERRGKLLTPYLLQREICAMTAALDSKQGDLDTCAPSLEAAQSICAAPGGPDFLVLGLRLERGLVDSWEFREPGKEPKTYYLHDCLHLR